MILKFGGNTEQEGRRTEGGGQRMSGEGQSQQGSRQSGPDGERTDQPEEKETVSAPLKGHRVVIVQHCHDGAEEERNNCVG